MTTPNYDSTSSGWGGEARWTEPRWTEPGWDAYPAPQPPPSPIPAASSSRAAIPSLVAVTGAVGSAGATTLAVLLGSALAREHGRRVLVLDATPAGGDMAARVYHTVQAGLGWDGWARAGASIDAATEWLGGSASGSVVLGAQPPVPDLDALLRTVIDRATAAGWIVVLDVGSGAVASPALAVAVAADAAVVIVLPQRAEGANRSRWFLSGMAQRYARDVVADAVVTMNDLDGSQPDLYDAIEQGLRGKVAAMVRVPTDPSLAAGLGIDVAQTAPETVVAVSELIRALGVTESASRRPAG